MAEQTEDQRAAEERVLELCDMDYERAAATCAEFDRLRAELAETRTAGDALNAAADKVHFDHSSTPNLGELYRKQREWEAVRGGEPAGRPTDAMREVNEEIARLLPPVDSEAFRARDYSVRGDAPTEPPADPQSVRPTFRDDPHPLYPHFPARGPGAIDAALDLLFKFAAGSTGERAADDLLVSARAELEHLIPAGPLLEQFPPPAVGLPVTLSSVDDVAAVARSCGLDTTSSDTWTEDGAAFKVVTMQSAWEFWGPSYFFGADYGTPSAVLVAAIEAARGGSR